MKTIVLSEAVEGQAAEIIEQLKELGYTVSVLAEKEEMVIVPDRQRKMQFFNDEITKYLKKELREDVNNWLDLYAVEFKENNLPRPAYISFEIESEYDDESYFPCLQDVTFYDHDENMLDVSFEIDDDEDQGATYVLKEQLAESFSVSDLQQCTGYDDGNLFSLTKAETP